MGTVTPKFPRIANDEHRMPRHNGLSDFIV